MLPPDPGRFFSGEVLAHPSVRGRGVVRHLMVASTHLLLERGVRERWFTINAPTHLSEDAFFRGAHARERVGTLTRRSHLGRVRYEFVPATAPTTPRLDRLVALLSALRGPVARVAVLLNHPASLTVDPRHAGDAIAGVAPPGVALSPVVVREPEDPAAALRRALGEIGRSGADGLVVLRDAMLARYARLIVAHAARWRLPAVYEGAPFAAAGGLVVCRAPVVPAHGWPEPLRRLGAAVDHGPDVVVNARAAGALGLALPSSLLSPARQALGTPPASAAHGARNRQGGAKMTERRKDEPHDRDAHDEDTAAPPAPGGPLPEREQDLEHKTDWERGTHD